MTWIDSRSFANKIVKILSDNKPLPSEWKYSIPLYIMHEPLPVVMNAKWLAEGILEGIELYHPDANFYSPSAEKYLQETLF